MTRVKLPQLFRTVNAIVFCVLFLFIISACSSTTTESKTGLIKGSMNERPAVAHSGFLGDYSQLRPGGEGRAAMVYVNPNAKWSAYHSIMIAPVQFWSSDNSVPASDQKVLTAYFYNALRTNLEKRFTLAEKPGPGVMELKTAITGASASTPVLRSVSVIVPQARVLSAAKSMATGSYAFVGSAQAEGEMVDSVSGKRLAAAIDKREGGMALQSAAQWKWGDAQNILDYWAKKIPDRIVKLQEPSRTGD
jgi:hypothetical protein